MISTHHNNQSSINKHDMNNYHWFLCVTLWFYIDVALSNHLLTHLLICFSWLLIASLFLYVFLEMDFSLHLFFYMFFLKLTSHCISFFILLWEIHYCKTNQKKKWSFKTGDLLKEVQFILNFSMTGQEKGDLLIQVTTWAGHTFHTVKINNVTLWKYISFGLISVDRFDCLLITI